MKWKLYCDYTELIQRNQKYIEENGLEKIDIKAKNDMKILDYTINLHSLAGELFVRYTNYCPECKKTCRKKYGTTNLCGTYNLEDVSCKKCLKLYKELNDLSPFYVYHSSTEKYLYYRDNQPPKLINKEDNE